MTSNKAYVHLKSIQARLREVERMMALNDERGHSQLRDEIIIAQLGFVEKDVLAIYREINREQES